MDTCFIEHTETAEIVTQLDDDNFLVNIKMQLISVKKAASCLLIPDAQDKVLIINTKDKEYYIICVLEKKSRQNNCLINPSSPFAPNLESIAQYTSLMLTQPNLLKGDKCVVL